MDPKNAQEVSIFDGNIIITPLLKAYKTFIGGLSSVKDELDRDGVIHRFSFTYELAWKTLKRMLAYKGTTAISPRDVIRFAAKEGFISDPETWFKFIEKRNETSHTYNEEIAAELFSMMPLFKTSMDDLIGRIKTL